MQESMSLKYEPGSEPLQTDSGNMPALTLVALHSLFVYLVIYDYGFVSLEHLLPSWYPSQIIR